MATSLKASLPAEPAMEPIERRVSEPPKREIRLSLTQMIVMWSVIAGTMVAVFMFGLFAGQEQGMRRALESQEHLAVRLPVPRAEKERAQVLPSVTSPTELTLLDKAPVPAKTEKPAGEVSAEILKTNDSAGFLAKSAGDVPAVKPTTPPSAEVKPSQAPLKTLASVAPPKVSDKKPEASAPKPAERAAGGKPSIVTNLSKGWYVQAVAERDQAGAEKFAQKLAANNFDVLIQRATVKKVQYFRVMVGPYGDKSAAQKVQGEMRQAKLIPGRPFLKRVR